MSKTTNPAVRFITGGAAEARPTIETPNGPIYADTPQAAEWKAAQNRADALTDLAAQFAMNSRDSAKILADIDALIPKIPEGEAGTRAVLIDLREAMHGRESNEQRMNYADPGQLFAFCVEHLRFVVAPRARQGATSLVDQAPKPYHPDGVRLAQEVAQATSRRA
jgi:hypothetical protein